MKRIIVVIIVFILISSCAVLPAKKNDKVLVIGSIELDYPDGFYDTNRSKTIISGTNVRVRNVLTEDEFNALSDKEGYFKFYANPGEQYKITGYENIHKINRVTYTTRQSLKIKFDIIDNNVNYIGHIKCVYTRGKVAENYYKDKTFHYNIDYSISYDQQNCIDYLREKKNGDLWLDDGIVSLSY